MSLGDAIANLHAAIGEVASVDPSDVVTAEGLAELLAAVKAATRRLDLVFVQLLRSFEARGDCGALGYATPAQFCKHRLKMGDRDARATLRLGRDLVFVPSVRERWAAGELGSEHARTILAARTEATAERFDATEGWFAEQAVTLDLRGLKIVMTRWAVRADPERDTPRRQERDRDAHVSSTFQDAVVMDGQWDPVRGAVVKAVFEDLVEELFRADWTEAKQRLGRDPLVGELARTAAQRRADAVVEMATRARMCTDARRGRPRPLVVVVTGLSALADGVAELWDQTPIDARQLADILARDPDIERFVYGSGELPIAYNERARFFTGKLREALQVRDRRCQGLGCDLPAERCDIDHIVPVAAGGRTRPDNGRVACSRDNRSRPRRRFEDDPDP